MKTYISEDKQVTKYIHIDGSETCIKTVPSLDTKFTNSGEVCTEVIDRNKYSLFLSHSTGCPFNCEFCYLTIDKVPYKKLGQFSVTNNAWDALQHRVSIDPSIRNRYAKICWMGMGEPILDAPGVRHMTMALLQDIEQENYSKGLDGVDISTILPQLPTNDWIIEFIRLEQELQEFPLNPNNKQADNVGENSTFVRYNNRSRFRLFYSLHSAIQETRDRIIPKAMPIEYALLKLSALNACGINVIIHHMFLEGTNDTQEELDELVRVMDWFPNSELRILRYNKHEDSDVRESDAFKECLCYLGGRVDKIKVQISQGTDVKSACGQFIYNNTGRVSSHELKEV